MGLQKQITNTKMKRLLLPLLAALALPTAVNAETWIEVANYSDKDGQNFIRWIDADSILGRGDWLYAKYRIKTEWSSGKRTKELKINCKKGIYVHDFDNSYVRFVRQRNGNWKLTFFGFGFDESKNPQLEGTYKFLCK